MESYHHVTGPVFGTLGIPSINTNHLSIDDFTRLPEVIAFVSTPDKTSLRVLNFILPRGRIQMAVGTYDGEESKLVSPSTMCGSPFGI